MFRAQNVTLKHLLVNAYGIREGLMFGLPGWAASLRFDINAKVTDPDLKTLHSLSKEQRQAMIAAILVDRFHLKLHTESKTLPVYELVVAKDGPKLTASAVPPPDAANPDPFGKMDVHNTDMTATGVTLSCNSRGNSVLSTRSHGTRRNGPHGPVRFSPPMDCGHRCRR